jgi:ceramide glucosyltransferase
VYAAQALLNPLCVARAGVALHPTGAALGGGGAGGALKIAYDAAALRAMRGRGVPLLAAAASPAKDLLLGAAWLHGLTHRNVEWRGNRLRVLPGTVLERPRDDGHASAPVAERRAA